MRAKVGTYLLCRLLWATVDSGEGES